MNRAPSQGQRQRTNLAIDADAFQPTKTAGGDHQV
jgi:hypothetical protein